jgi:hypothetical protein
MRVQVRDTNFDAKFVSSIHLHFDSRIEVFLIVRLCNAQPILSTDFTVVVVVLNKFTKQDLRFSSELFE